MPIYVYQCQKCGKEFEYMQSMTEPAKTECEACGGRLQRVIARAAFHLKGGGWHKDLYSSPRSGGGGGEGEKKSEGKPAGESAPAKKESKKETKE